MSKMESETLREITVSLSDGNYSVVSTIREGRLYLAEKAGKRVVLKTARGAKGLDLLKREYEIALRLQHPFIASAIGWEESTPIGPAIVIEYIRGRSLSAFLQEKPSLQARRRIFSQILEAVGAIHRQSIIHNDIKPDNILITEADNDVKLIDFGFSDADSHILERGLGGTRQYASPELLAPRETDARSDIYSIGRLMKDIFPGRYGRIVRRCLRLDPTGRYQSVDALMRAWNWYWWPAGALAAAALVIGLCIYTLMPSGLDRAKAQVDCWYETRIPAFREALEEASSREEVNAAWTDLCSELTFINQELPEKLPEKARPAYRDYIIEKYNSTFPALQEILIERMGELQ